MPEDAATAAKKYLELRSKQQKAAAYLAGKKRSEGPSMMAPKDSGANKGLGQPWVTLVTALYYSVYCAVFGKMLVVLVGRVAGGSSADGS